MTSVAPDRLAPVLAVTGLVLAGTLLVEMWADGRDLDTLVIPIEPGSTAPTSEIDEAQDAEAPTTGPVSETHTRARELARRGELHKAIALFEALVLEHPTEARLEGELGFWLMIADRDPEALKRLLSARHRDPTNPWLALTTGRAHRRLEQWKKAETAYRDALELRPGYGSARLSLGLLLLRQDRAPEAIAILEEAARSGGNEQVARARVALGRAYLAVGEPARATGAFTDAINRAPASVDIRLSIARAFLGSDEPEALATAQSAAEEAGRLAPDVPAVHAVRGRVAEKLQEDLLAERHYTRALRLDPTYAYARRRLLRLALGRRDFPLARMHAGHLLREEPDEAEHHFLAGLVEARARRTDRAREHYVRAIERAAGTYPEALLNLGRLERRAGDLAASIAAYRRAIEQRPGYRAAMNNLGLVLQQARRWSEAERTYGELLERHPSYAGGWLNLGGLLADEKRYDEAIAAYSRALEVQPNYPKALLNLGVTQTRKGDLNAAVTTYGRLVDLQPRYASAWYNLGLTLEKQSKQTEARDAYARTLAIDPERVPALRKIAVLETRLGNLDVAQRYLGELTDRIPSDAGVRMDLARLHARRGETGACMRELRVVLASNPGDREATDLLKQCQATPRPEGSQE